jgi:hypothetical protein
MRPGDLEGARHLGVTEVVLKPHTPRELSAALQRVMGMAQGAGDSSSER